MVKISSICFTVCLTLLMIMGIALSFIPTSSFIETVVSGVAIALLLSGIWLIISLIIDRFQDIKNEGDDYKKY